MYLDRSRLSDPRLLKGLAAVVVGLGVGTMVPPQAMHVPVIGPTSSLAVGLGGVVLGVALFRAAPRVAGSTDCGCGEDCSCG